MRIASAIYNSHHFKNTFRIFSPHDLQDASLLVVWGGEDISPCFYGQRVAGSYSRDTASDRDKLESILIKAAVKMKIPILGICRGAQMLCALDGGSLWQHVDGHVGNHKILTKDGRELFTNSLHHQMMRPKKNAEILAWSKCLGPFKQDDTGVHFNDEDEPEIVFFPDMNALGVQGHPEYLKQDHDLCQETARIIKDKFNLEVY